jgi:large subunit ribosomal protein L24
MKIKKGDKVKVLSGKDRGKIATVLKVMPSKDKVVVEGVNMVKKHIKPGTATKEGGIVSIEKPVYASTVMYYNEKEKKSERVSYKKIDGKKLRFSKINDEVLDKKVAKK